LGTPGRKESRERQNSISALKISLVDLLYLDAIESERRELEEVNVLYSRNKANLDCVFVFFFFFEEVVFWLNINNVQQHSTSDRSPSTVVSLLIFSFEKKKKKEKGN